MDIDTLNLSGPGLDPGHAALGAAPGGCLEAPSLHRLLATLLAVQPAGRIRLSQALLPQWGHRIEDRGGRPAPLEDAEPHGLAALRGALAGAPDQVWLDLGGTPAPDPAAIAAFLDLAGALPEPPLVVLLRDDAPALARTQRLAVDRPGRVLLLRETPGGRAYALGRPDLVGPMAAAAGWQPRGGPLPPAAALPGTHLLALDIDGVLIDPGGSMEQAVTAALAEMAPGLAWSDGDYLAFKRAGGFNNDFRLVAAALAMGERDGGFGDLAAVAGGGSPLEPRVSELEPGCTVVLRRHHEATLALERPLVSLGQLAAFPGDLALFTGRPPEELAMAFALLGFELPGVGDFAPHLRKPRSEGLLQLADGFRAERILFVGDSADDATALRGARALRPDLDWRFCVVGPERARIAGAGDRQCAGVAELLAGTGA